MTRVARGAVAIAVALFVLTLWASTSGPVRIWHPAPDPAADTVGPPEGSIAVEDTTPVTRPDPEPSSDDDILPIVETIVLAGLLAAVAFIAYVMRSAFEPLRWRGRKRTDDLPVLPDLADAVTENADAQMAALVHGDPRNAIVACWVRLEDTVATAGLRPNPAETAAELTTRVLSTYPVARDAIEELAGLYREARFSHHELREHQRDRAVAALRRLHDDLATRAAVEAS
jgi:hypothetical protein